MSSREEELRFIRQHSKVAIDYAMAGKWAEAIEENKIILESYPEDIDSLNRLGRAYIEINQLADAKSAYLKAKELDPYNNIAIKNLAKLENIQDASVLTQKAKIADPRLFIEEVGKAANISVVNLLDKKAIAKISAGESATLKIEGKHLCVYSILDELIGWVEPKTEKRLLKLIDGGNKYQALFSSVSADEVVVLIRETYQHPSQIGIMSFATKGIEIESSDSKNNHPGDEDSELSEGAEFDVEEEPEIMDDEDDEEDENDKVSDDEEV